MWGNICCAMGDYQINDAKSIYAAFAIVMHFSAARRISVLTVQNTRHLLTHADSQHDHCFRTWLTMNICLNSSFVNLVTYDMF